MKHRYPFSKGFTLLELLVVISIIGILTAVGLASFTDAQIKARDTKRVSDMKAFQNVYEQYYAANGRYGTSTVMAVGFSGGVAPSDPRVSTTQPNYAISANIDTTQTYCVCARVENTNNGNSANNTCTVGLGGATMQFYCVRNLQ